MDGSGINKKISRKATGIDILSNQIDPQLRQEFRLK